MKTFVASRFSEGNHFFPLEINLNDSEIEIISPNLIKNEVIKIDYKQVKSFKKIKKEEYYGLELKVNDVFLTKSSYTGFSKEDNDALFLGIRLKLNEIKNAKKQELKKVSKEFNALQGLEELKQLVNNQIILSNYYENIDNKEEMSNHFVFFGNPGTGKTSVARLIGKMYYHHGMLQTDNFIECSRVDLVGQYIGQTAIKTQELLDQALGGILFIDEAYSLVSGGEKDFGLEAINTILKFMEDYRARICIIVAGYPDLMKSFIRSNPGLKSRFSHFIEFKDFNALELLEITNSFLKNKKINISKAIKEKLQNHFANLLINEKENFGNGRVARNIAEKIIANYDLRIANEYSKTKKMPKTRVLVLQDLNFLNILAFENKKSRTIVGYKK